MAGTCGETTTSNCSMFNGDENGCAQNGYWSGDCKWIGTTSAPYCHNPNNCGWWTSSETCPDGDNCEWNTEALIDCVMVDVEEGTCTAPSGDCSWEYSSCVGDYDCGWNDQGGCEDRSPYCTWDSETASCSGNGTCVGFNYDICEDFFDGGCSALGDCSSSECNAIETETPCFANPNCYWDVDYCYSWSGSTPCIDSGDCESETLETCASAGCIWIGTNNRCYGNFGCDRYTSYGEAECEEVGCTWDEPTIQGYTFASIF